MTKLAIFALLVSPVFSATWTFPAGAPEPAKSGGYAFPMDDARYAKFVDQTKASGNVVPIVKKPANLSPSARYGYNFVVGGRNRGWILDGDEEHGWVLYLDWRGDGNLSAAEPRKFDRTGIIEVQVPDGDLRWPCRFEVRKVNVEGEERLGVQIIDGTVRRGTIEFEGKRYPFSLAGSRGLYNSEYNHLSVDRFGKGDFDSYKATDQYLNLAGKSYEFAVDPHGSSLTLTELAEARPERPSLKVGSAAPEFAAQDLDGSSRSLAGYRGKTLLLELWSTACGPCRAEAPRMVELYKALDRAKVDFLGVSSDTSEDTLRAFLREQNLSWPQLREPFEGAVHQLYRVGGEPTYYLIGPDGKILDAWVGSGETSARLTKANLYR